MGLSTPSTSSSELESLSASSGDEKKQQDSDGKWKQSRLSVSASSSMEDLEEMEQSGIDEEGGICTDVTSSGDVRICGGITAKMCGIVGRSRD